MELKSQITNLDFETRVCPACGAKMAKTPDNPEGICTSCACTESRPLYNERLLSTDSEEDYDRKMAEANIRCNLRRKYKGLFFASPSIEHRLHFLHALKDRKLVFVEDKTYTMLVVHEDRLEEISKEFPINNYKDYLLESK